MQASLYAYRIANFEALPKLLDVAPAVCALDCCSCATFGQIIVTADISEATIKICGFPDPDLEDKAWEELHEEWDITIAGPEVFHVHRAKYLIGDMVRTVTLNHVDQEPGLCEFTDWEYLDDGEIPEEFEGGFVSDFVSYGAGAFHSTDPDSVRAEAEAALPAYTTGAIDSAMTFCETGSSADAIAVGQAQKALIRVFLETPLEYDLFSVDHLNIPYWVFLGSIFDDNFTEVMAPIPTSSMVEIDDIRLWGPWESVEPLEYDTCGTDGAKQAIAPFGVFLRPCIDQFFNNLPGPVIGVE